MTVSVNNVKNTAKLLIVAAMTASMFVGCSCSNKQSTEENTTDGKDTSKKNSQTTADNSTIKCSDEKLKASLLENINLHMQQGALSQAQNNTEQNGLTLSPDNINTKMQNVIVEVQNLQALKKADGSSSDPTACQASVSMTLSNEDLFKASQIYAANNQISLQQQMADENIKMNNNMLVDDGFMYVINNTAEGEPQAKIIGEPTILNAVAGVVVSSVLKDAISSKKAKTSTTNKPRANQPTKPKATKPKPAQPKPAKPKPKPKPKTTASKPKNSSNNTIQWYESDQPTNAAASSNQTAGQNTPAKPKAKTDNKPESLDPLVKKFAESQQAKQPKPAKAAKVNKPADNKPAATPKSAPKAAKAPVDDNVDMVITHEAVEY